MTIWSFQGWPLSRLALFYRKNSGFYVFNVPEWHTVPISRDWPNILKCPWVNHYITSGKNSPPIKITNYQLVQPWYPVSESDAEDDFIRLNWSNEECFRALLAQKVRYSTSIHWKIAKVWPNVDQFCCLKKTKQWPFEAFKDDHFHVSCGFIIKNLDSTCSMSLNDTLYQSQEIDPIFWNVPE